MLATNSTDSTASFAYRAVHVVADTRAFTPAMSNSCSTVNGSGSAPTYPVSAYARSGTRAGVASNS